MRGASAIADLMPDISPTERTDYAGLATTIFMLGWATGGIIFGIMGDRFGRAKTMLLTIFLYSLLTGLSALSVGFYDFACYRFLTGLGVGGEFAVGITLLAEVMPERARPHALGWLQGLSTVGNISANVVGLALASLEETDKLYSDWKPWRFEFLVGALPALMIVVVARRLKEPERWREMRANLKPGQRLGSMLELLRPTGHPSECRVRVAAGHGGRGGPLGHRLFRVRFDA